MLVLSRKINQSIMIGDDVRIVIVAVDRDQVKLGIEAPRAVPVHRSEVYEEIRKANQEALGAAPVASGKPERATLRPRTKPQH
ncbi:MAG: carbon storage regulator CsrA [Candidatus Aquilonibacter sp.]|jgi:carbon storage regulator